MVSAINRLKSKFTSCLLALNGVLGCGGGIRVFINSLGGVGDSTSLSSLSLLDSFMFMSYTNYTSGLVGTPPFILMSVIMFLGVSRVDYISTSVGDLSP
jgi:hypothetical protein